MSRENKPDYNRTIFIAIWVIALGITLTTVFENVKPAGIVMIAVGGFFLIVGMKKKKDHDEKNK